MFKVDCNQNLEWFKDAQKMQGSVSTKSLMEAQQANQHGCYIVGNIKGTYDTFIWKEATLNEVIELQIGPDNDPSKKTYSLEQVHELQSRLMLLGGDVTSTGLDNKNSEKEYFVQV